MAYLLDGALLVLFGVMIYMGHRNGFIKTVAGVISFVLALVLSSMLTAPVTDFVYDTVIEPSVMESLNENLGETSPAAEQLDAAFKQMPAFITNQLIANGINSGADVLTYLGHAQEGETVAESVARQIVVPVVMPVLEGVCSLVLFLVFQFALSLLLKAMNLLTKLPLLKQINKSLGVVAGIVQGVLWVFFVVTLLQIVSATGLFPWLSADILDSTILIRWINSMNPVTEAVRELVF